MDTINRLSKSRRRGKSLYILVVKGRVDARTSTVAPPTNTIQPMINAPASAEKGQSNTKIKENVDVAGIKTRQIGGFF